jgi:DNA-binding MarR family transcriptional regulator
MDKQLYQKFTLRMNRFFQKVMILERAEKFCYGVTLSQAYAIGFIAKNGQLTMNELSQELGLALSTLTRIVDVLVRDQIVARRQSEHDRRKVLVELTPAGNELAEKLNECTEKFWKRIFDKIPERDQEPVTEHLKMLLHLLEESENRCCSKK